MVEDFNWSIWNSQYFHLEKHSTNGIDQQQTTVVAPNDIQLEENMTDTIPLDNDIHNHSQDMFVLTDEVPE